MDNELSKGFTGVEINGVRFSNLGEMLRYMDKQREQLIKAKELLNMFLRLHYLPIVDEATLYHKVEQFLKEIEG